MINPAVTMSRVPRFVLFALLSLALLAGCGGSASREEFQQDVVDARDRVDSGLAQVTTAGSFDELLDRLEIAAIETRKAATEIRKADAPGGLNDEKRALESSLRALSDEILGTAETLDGLGQHAPVTRGINFENWDVVQSDLAALRDADIQVPPLERHGGAPAEG